MKRVLTAVVLIPLVLVVLFKAPLWLFTLVVGVVAMGAAWEFLNLVDLYAGKSSKFVPLSLAALVFLTAAFTRVPFLALGTLSRNLALLIIPSILMASGPFLIVAFALSRSDVRNGFIHGAMSAFVFPYIVWSLMALTAIRPGANGIVLILFLFVAVWVGDIFAYYVGRAIGRHKLAPSISPGKTWEGTLASVIASVFFASILFAYQADLATWIQGFPYDADHRWHMTVLEQRLVGVALAFLVNVAAQIGDLVESMIKRGAGVKDSGSLLPGHGGILDRIDALLFAVPIVFFYTMLNPIRSFYTALSK